MLRLVPAELNEGEPASDPVNHPGPYERAQDSGVRIARNYVEEYSDDFIRRRQVEARFEIPVSRGLVSGAIDLLLKEDEDGNILEAEVIDFKAMEAGPDPPAQPALE